MSESNNDVIFTPIYRGTRYLYHECSECNYHVRMSESIGCYLYFGENFKFCPNCGKPVIRFANLPKFLEEFPRVEFEKIEQLYDEYKTRLDYYLRITLTQEEFEELKQKCQFAVALRKNGDMTYVSPSVELVANMNTKKWNHWEIKKLREKVEKSTEN